MRFPILSPEDIDNLKKDLETNATLVSIAKKFNITRRTLHNYRKKYECLNLVKKRIANYKLTPSDIKEIACLRDEGKSYQKISKLYNVAPITVWRVIKKLNNTI